MPPQSGKDVWIAEAAEAVRHGASPSRGQHEVGLPGSQIWLCAGGLQSLPAGSGGRALPHLLRHAAAEAPLRAEQAQVWLDPVWMQLALVLIIAWLTVRYDPHMSPA